MGTSDKHLPDRSVACRNELANCNGGCDRRLVSLMSKSLVLWLPFLGCVGTAPSVSTDATSTTTDAVVSVDATTSFADAMIVGPDAATGPNVDVSMPQLYDFSFSADQADATATEALVPQHAYLDTRVAPLGTLVVYLHGAGTQQNCGSTTMMQWLAAKGYHVFSPCYRADYGVGNCGDDIGGCRLEAFEGVDHHAEIDISRPNSAEGRVVAALAYLQEQHPGGDWEYFLGTGGPRWSEIIVAGISHGASSSGVIGMNRNVNRVVMLSGPLDSNQAWLQGTPVTPIDRFYGFTHTQDSQNPGHRNAFADMNLPGAITNVEDNAAPYGGSHRLESSFDLANGHSSTQAGGASPMNGAEWVYEPVWRALFGL